ncbi:MAG: 50S ribosomal protein L9 [Sediminibacterium sp.]|nr:50S ribosomal protein L9 [Sediminibacterium sp.]
MQVVLIQDHQRLGSKDTVVTVKNGYGRNYLIPQKFALEATESNLKQLAERNKVKDKRNQELIAKIDKVMEQLSNTTIILKTKAGTSNRIFGRITSLQISQEIKKLLGVTIDKKIIFIDEEIKELGNYKGRIDFSINQTCEFSFNVEAE